MNLSLSSLKLSTYAHSPLYSVSSISSPTTFTLHKSDFGRCFSSILRNTDMAAISTISKSNFKSFLETPIVIDSARHFNQTFEKQLFVYRSPVATIIDLCRFENCVSIRSHGGAVFFNNGQSIIWFRGCSFRKCESKQHGGAVYAFTNGFLFSRCYFAECLAKQQSNALVIYTVRSNYSSNLTDTTVTSCFSGTRPLGKSSVSLADGIIGFRSYNSSKNLIEQDSSSATLILNKHVIFAFCNFEDNTAPYIIKNYGVNQTLEIIFCNMLSNNARKALMQLSANTVVSDCVIFGNNADYVLEGTSKSVHFKDCVTDSNITAAKDTNLTFTTEKIQIMPEAKPLDLYFGDSGFPSVLQLEDFEEAQRAIIALIGDKPLKSSVDDQLLMKHNEAVVLSLEKLTPYPTLEARPTRVFQPRTPISKKTVEATGQIVASTPTPAQTRVKQSKFDIGEEEEELSTATPSKSLAISTPKPHTKSVKKPRSAPPRKRKTKKPELRIPTTPQPTPTIQITSTFTSTSEFTSDYFQSPSTVPYVLYSAAAFVLLAVFASFCFIRTEESGYNIITASESTDARLSDSLSQSMTPEVSL